MLVCTNRRHNVILLLAENVTLLLAETKQVICGHQLHLSLAQCALPMSKAVLCKGAATVPYIA